MRAILLEGTSEEVQEAIERFSRSSNAVLVSKTVEDPQSDEEDDDTDADDSVSPSDYMSMPAYRNFLTRRKLGTNARTVLKTIANAKNRMVTATEIMNALGLGASEFRGVMGALGKRCANTEGYISGQSIFIQDRDPVTREYSYMAPDALRQAMVAENMIKG